MSESLSPTEQEGAVITREMVVDAYGRFVERGIKNPDDLNLDDEEVKKANEQYQEWRKQEQKKSAGNKEMLLRNNLATTMLYVDAGFNDPEYLDEILNDQLVQDEEEAEEQADNPERAETRRQIEEAKKRVEELIAKQEK